MSSFRTMNTAVSGLQAAQANLYVTGHNMSNVNTLGYVRQQVIQSDARYNNIGKFSAGTMQVGLGTNVATIRQIRDRFLDMSYRKGSAKLGFHSTAYNVGVDIEGIIGELEGEYKLQSVLKDLKNSLSELSIDPTGVDTRGDFISTCVTFIDKANDAYNSMFEQQQELNDNITKMVKRINELLDSINDYNRLISQNEASGDNANDYRDMRENCLDELSLYLDISYKVRADHTVDIHSEGNELLANGVVNRMGLRYTGPNYNFVEPVFTASTSVLPYDPTGQNARLVFRYDRKVSSEAGNDNGMLKGLIIARGLEPVTFADSPGSLTPVAKCDPSDPNYPDYLAYIKAKFNIENCIIPKAMLQLDTLVNSIVKLINGMFSPRRETGTPGVYEPGYEPPANPADYPYGIDGSQDFFEIFVRAGSAYKYNESSNTILGEDPDDYYSLYTIGNIMLNPELRNASNYKRMTLSASGDQSDNTIILDLLKQWDTGFIAIDKAEKLSVDDFYKQIISNISIDISEHKKISETETQALNEVDNKRQQISGVSLDEEMTSMLKYQHAYNAAARLVNYIDSMIDKIINGTGRVGL